MNVKRWIRHGWAAYLVILCIGIILLLTSLLLPKDSTLKGIFIDIGGSLTTVGIVFFLVDQFLMWSPFDAQTEKLDDSISELKSVVQSQRDATSVIYPSREAVYDAGILTLNTVVWDTLRIFAPVGLWEKNELKRKWLDAVARSAADSKVRSVHAVFGLPPISSKDERIPTAKIVEKLVQARKALDSLNAVKNISLHFYPPFPASVGFGTIIFEEARGRGRVVFAFSSREDVEAIDCGFGTNDRDLFDIVVKWFDDQIFHKATDTFVLQEHGKAIADTWDSVIRSWYGENILTEFRTSWGLTAN